MSEIYDQEDMHSVREPESSLLPPFKSGVAVLLGKTSNGTFLVHESVGIVGNVIQSFGKLKDAFEGVAIRDNPAFAIKSYSEEEFRQEFPDFENQIALVDDAFKVRKEISKMNLEEMKSHPPTAQDMDRVYPDGVDIVTLAQYKEGHDLIDGNVQHFPFMSGDEIPYHSAYRDLSDCELDMESRMSEMSKDIQIYRNKMEFQKSVLDDFSFQEALQPSNGAELEHGFELGDSEYDVGRVVILLDEQSGLAHRRFPDHGCVVLLESELDKLKENGEIITSGQFGADLIDRASGSGIGAHKDAVEAARFKEMKADFEDYKAGVIGRFSVLDSASKLLSDGKEPQMEEPSNDAALMMQP